MLSSTYFYLIWSILFLNFNFDDRAISSSSNTSLYFDVVLKGKKIGSLKTNRIIKKSKTYYHASTTITTKIIKNIIVNYTYDVNFENDILNRASVAININEKPHANTLTQRKDNQYTIKKNGKYDATVKEAIDYSTIQLYFKEPTNIGHCYSEQDGSFNTLISQKNHRYKKINSKGKENIYQYESGVLKKAQIDAGLVEFDLIARK